MPFSETTHVAARPNDAVDEPARRAPGGRAEARERARAIAASAGLAVAVALVPVALVPVPAAAQAVPTIPVLRFPSADGPWGCRLNETCAPRPAAPSTRPAGS